jgi:transcriptional regulator with XRE-family HTH domain
MSVGQRVRERRTALGLSQENLAHQAGLSLNAMHKLEAGRTTDPHYSTLSGIAHALGTTVAELVGEKPAIPKASAPPETGQPEGQWPKTVTEVREKYLPIAAVVEDYTRVYERLAESGELRTSDVRELVRTAVQANPYHLMLLESELVELGVVLGPKLTRQEQLPDLSVIQPALSLYRSLIRALVESLPAGEEKNALAELAGEVRG